MKLGTKSLLFGIHQFIWHPVTVWLAWIWLYRTIPTWRETICIIVHDWGYWGMSDIDGDEGILHPELGAKIAGRLLDRGKSTRYRDLCIFHSRSYAKLIGVPPSKLCWADKASAKFEPTWWKLFRACATGGLEEVRQSCGDPTLTDREILRRGQEERIQQALEQFKKVTAVCLCGSTKHKSAFAEAGVKEALSGKVVLAPQIYSQADGISLSAEQIQTLEKVHDRKIELADEVLVINPDGRIGESTAREIHYAERLGKPIRYLQPTLNAAA